MPSLPDPADIERDVRAVPITDALTFEVALAHLPRDKALRRTVPQLVDTWPLFFMPVCPAKVGVRVSILAVPVSPKWRVFSDRYEYTLVPVGEALNSRGWCAVCGRATALHRTGSREERWSSPMP